MLGSSGEERRLGQVGPPDFLQEGTREESSSDCKKQSVRMIVLKGRKVSSDSGRR